ncbi:hypothetical protein [Micromonospora sp. 15K316]|uniref:hypothetical protein n=1 Tax=Micromonospora sp. 15K316 TaxID=2530376 RepID=UPI001A9D98B2|nr:hypothetical protein [Micromonospora sp. 15K316]
MTVPPPGPALTGPDDTGLLPKVTSRRRRHLLAMLGLVAVLSAVGLVLGLLSWAPEPPEPARALTVGEAERLAAVRVTNYRDLRAGVHVTLGAEESRTELVGWVDWSRPLLYLDVGGPGAGAERGLLQATPAVLVIRPDPWAVPTAATPPLVPPTDRWRLHDLPDGHALAPVLKLLFDLAADRTDPVPAADARWVASETLSTGPVDVLQAHLPGAASSPAGPDGRPRYWVDDDARLHRMTARLPGAGTVTVELKRTDRPTLRPVDALGGRPGLPRALTAAERTRLERLPQRLRARQGATVTLTAPVGRETNLRGAGWLSWTRRTGYLAVADLGVPQRRTLLWRGPTGVSRAQVPATGDPEKPGRPPLPPPAKAVWTSERAGANEVAALLDAALGAGAAAPRGTAVRLREDTLADRAVDVVELRGGRDPLRYWIDRDGLLRRVELRTGAATWAQLDLQPGRVPALPAPKPAAGSTGRSAAPSSR